MTQSTSPDGPSREEHRSPKAARTRRRLLAAARAVFERDGFLQARVVDIAKEAGVSHGSFYTYFDSKQQIFRAVVADFTAQTFLKPSNDDSRELTIIQRIERGNRQFYDTYRANLRMYELYEEAASYDDEVREHRIGGRDRAEIQVRRSIERFQKMGLTSKALDPAITASCLVAMATHSFFTWHVREERGYDVELALRTLTHLWASALGLQPEPGDDEFYKDLARTTPTENEADQTPSSSRQARTTRTRTDRATSRKAASKSGQPKPRDSSAARSLARVRNDHA